MGDNYVFSWVVEKVEEDFGQGGRASFRLTPCLALLRRIGNRVSVSLRLFKAGRDIDLEVPSSRMGESLTNDGLATNSD